MPDLVLSLPLTPIARSHAIAEMSCGRASSIQIGQCSLHVDQANGLIWGCDAYGQDRIAANAEHVGSMIFDRAIDWAIAEHARPLGDHPAERTYDALG